VGNADYDGDGYADLLARNPKTGNLTIHLLRNGRIVKTGGFQIQRSQDVVGSADYDGNGYGDFLLRSRNNRRLTLWSLLGTDVLEITSLPRADADAEIVGSGDYDGDGQHDILWRDGREIFVWYLDDPANPEEETIAEIAQRWQAAGTGDYDGDGISDVLLRNKQGGRLKMYLVKSTPPALLRKVDSGHHLADSEFGDYEVAGSADFDGDGFCDIALSHMSGMLRLLYMEGHRVQDTLWVEELSRSWSVDGVGLENPTSD
jgi:hypothetical protein